MNKSGFYISFVLVGVLLVVSPFFDIGGRQTAEAFNPFVGLVGSYLGERASNIYNQGRGDESSARREAVLGQIYQLELQERVRIRDEALERAGGDESARQRIREQYNREAEGNLRAWERELTRLRDQDPAPDAVNDQVLNELQNRFNVRNVELRDEALERAGDDESARQEANTQYQANSAAAQDVGTQTFNNNEEDLLNVEGILNDLGGSNQIFKNAENIKCNGGGGGGGGGGVVDAVTGNAASAIKDLLNPECVLRFFMYGLSVFFLLVGQFVLIISMAFFHSIIEQFVTGLTVLMEKIGIESIWIIFRNLINLVLVFSLVAIGISMILRITSFGNTGKLVQLLIAATLINFSLFFAKDVMIGTSNLFINSLQSFTFAEANSPPSNTPGSSSATPEGSSSNTQSVAGKIYTTSGIGKIETCVAGRLNDSNNDGLNLANALEFMLGSIIIFALYVLLATMFVYVGFHFLVRGIYLIVLAIASPVGFIWFIPKLRDFAADWWKKIIANAFIVPMLFLVMIISIKIMGTTGSDVAQACTAAARDTTNNVLSPIDYFKAITSMMLTIALGLGFFIIAKKKIVENIDSGLANALATPLKAAGGKLRGLAGSAISSVGGGTLGLAGKGANVAGKGVGKSIGLAGKGIGLTGKGVSGVGGLTESLGRKVLGAGVVGGAVGGALIAAGKTGKVAGKGVELAGKGVGRVGKGVEKTTEVVGDVGKEVIEKLNVPVVEGLKQPIPNIPQAVRNRKAKRAIEKAEDKRLAELMKDLNAGKIRFGSRDWHELTKLQDRVAKRNKK
ncbi:MAG: hypothetical protein OXU73_00380 [Candidatus Campbellbacteria bacterium]|nr:hypothetical protein [Candidatus Campbellbacteria bacterium]